MVERTITTAKNARAERAKVLFFIVKYANLSRSCCRRRRGCLNSLITEKVFSYGTATLTVV